MQPTPRTLQPLAKPSRETALVDRAWTLLRAPAALRVRTPAGIDRQLAERLAVSFFSRGPGGHYDYPHEGRFCKRLSGFVRALVAVIQAEHKR